MRQPIGTRVKYSLYALRPLRDGYLDKGEPSRKARAKEYHDREAAKRGTITRHLFGGGVETTWDDGSVSQSLDYRVTEAE